MRLRIGRAGLIAITLVLTLLLISACGAQTTPTTQATESSSPSQVPPTKTAAPTEELTGPITVLEWSAYSIIDNPGFAKPFTDKYGDKVKEKVAYNFFAEDAEAYSKLQSGVEADLVHPCIGWTGLYVKNDLLQPIDTSRLKNWKGVLPKFVDMSTFDGKVYYMPWDWGYESILVRSDLVKKVPESWADLWDPQYKGHVALWDAGEANYLMTALALGIDPYKATPEERTRIKDKLKELIPNLLTYWVDYTEAYQLPVTGDAWLVVNAWQDAYRNGIDSGVKVEYIQPKEKRLGWVCSYGIPKGVTGARLDRVYELLDALLAPESMAALATAYWYGFSNMDALPLVSKDVIDLMQLDHPEEIEKRTYFYQPMDEDLRKQVVDMWSEVKAGK